MEPTLLPTTTTHPFPPSHNPIPTHFPIDPPPSPIEPPANSPSQVNETNKCVAACPQGDGSAAETKAYGQCTKACIDKYYFDPATGTPATTTDTPNSNGGSNNNGGDSNNDSNDAPSGTSGDQASGTNSGAKETKTDSAAAGMVNMAGGGLLALVMGVLAL